MSSVQFSPLASEPPTHLLAEEHQREVRMRHQARIRGDLIEMRTYLRKAEEANRRFETIKAAYRENGLGRAELVAALNSNTDAQFAISDEQMYTRWAERYATAVSAEIAAYKLGIHADGWSKEK